MDKNTLQIPHPPTHSYILIAVAGERLNGKSVSDIRFLESEKGKYKIIDRIELLRGEFMPMTPMLLATGQFLTSGDVFKAYNKSNNLYFFVCEKIDSNTT